MTNKAKEYAAGVRILLERAIDGVDAISKLPAAEGGAAATSMPNEAAFFDDLRPLFPKSQITPEQFAAIKRAIARGFNLVVAAPKVGITEEDYSRAALKLGWSVPQIKAVDRTESAGGGWFTDIRADILALDGDGGFLDGNLLPKILYEAHVFARNCSPKGKFNTSHPNLSSASWNKALYVGGQGEYARLWKAVQLDRDAAFKAISIGRYQILGENARLAGFGNAEAFFNAMCGSERSHLDAFVTFIVNSGLVDEGRRISASPKDCEPFALGYNGPKALTHGYDTTIAKHFKAASATK